MYIVQNDYFCQLAYSQALVVCKKTKLQLTNFFWFFQMNNQMFFKKFINILALCEFQSRLRFWFKELCNELLLLGTNFILLIYNLCILRFTSLDRKKMYLLYYTADLALDQRILFVKINFVGFFVSQPKHEFFSGKM